LLKPIDTVDLVATVKRAETNARLQPEQMAILQQYYAPSSNPPTRTAVVSRIALSHASGIVFVETAQIVYCEADSNYTRFYLTKGEVYMVTKTLGDVQEVLEMGDFVRVHRQYIVNLGHIQKLVKGEGTYLQMSNGTTIPVARQQKERLMERFGVF
jgi:two-component system LytT family response regulator